MILLHRHRFSVAQYHRSIDPDLATESLAQGLVVPVQLSFERWLDERPCRAEAFLDPGADSSTISLRWLRNQAEEVHSTALVPSLSPSGYIKERIELRLSGQRLDLGDSDRPVFIGRQDEDGEDFQEMPGLEDLLLGRDFLTQHGLLIVIDGKQRHLSILAPIDSENQHRRQRILEAMNPESHLYRHE